MFVEYVEFFIMDRELLKQTNRAIRWNTFFKTEAGKPLLDCIRNCNKSWKPNEDIGVRVSNLFHHYSDPHHYDLYDVPKKVFRLSEKEWAQNANMFKCICEFLNVACVAFTDAE